MKEQIKKTPKDKHNIKLFINSELITDPLKIANIFNDFITSIGESSNLELK